MEILGRGKRNWEIFISNNISLFLSREETIEKDGRIVGWDSFRGKIWKISILIHLIFCRVSSRRWVNFWVKERGKGEVGKIDGTSKKRKREKEEKGVKGSHV